MRRDCGHHAFEEKLRKPFICRYIRCGVVVVVVEEEEEEEEDKEFSN
jgi:hypothetical protein